MSVESILDRAMKKATAETGAGTEEKKMTATDAAVTNEDGAREEINEEVVDRALGTHGGAALDGAGMPGEAQDGRPGEPKGANRLRQR